MVSSTIPTGTRLGPHEIERLLGAGGMGGMYLALATVFSIEEGVIRFSRAELPRRALFRRGQKAKSETVLAVYTQRKN